MAQTLSGLDPDMKYAVASRDLVRATEWARQWGFKKVYGSYQELVDDPDVDIVYIATPHSHHFEHASLAIKAGKPVLCEKPLTPDTQSARELFALAAGKGVYITEAFWTRFMPLTAKVKQLLDEGAIGKPEILNASLCYWMKDKERIMDPALCGGALLDVGVYCINFCRYLFGSDIVRQISTCTKSETGVDMNNAIIWVYRDGKMANLQSSAACGISPEAQILGDKGKIVVDDITCPHIVSLYDSNNSLIERFNCPETQISGYEYEVIASMDAIRKGMLESPYMPHSETVENISTMESLLKEWGVVYPI